MFYLKKFLNLYLLILFVLIFVYCSAFFAFAVVNKKASQLKIIDEMFMSGGYQPEESELLQRSSFTGLMFHWSYSNKINFDHINNSTNKYINKLDKRLNKALTNNTTENSSNFLPSQNEQKTGRRSATNSKTNSASPPGTNTDNEIEHPTSAVGSSGPAILNERSKYEKYASSCISNSITNANIVFETKIRIIDILQVCIFEN